MALHRVLLLGDSVTFAGTWAAAVQAALLTRDGDQAPELINLGVSSENVSGLSEHDHPFPRPCVLGRVDRALDQVRPRTTVLAYGMNDGAFGPVDEARFRAFTGAYRELVDRVRRAGSRVIALTPHPFEIEAWAPEDRRAAGLPLTSYGYLTPYTDYDADVLAVYAKWMVRELPAHVDAVVDVRPAFVAERRSTGQRLTGDGIHPGARGHWLIARELLRQGFGLPVTAEPAWVGGGPDPLHDAVAAAVSELGGAWREHVGHDNPSLAGALPVAEAERRAADLRVELVRSLSHSAPITSDAPPGDDHGSR